MSTGDRILRDHLLELLNGASAHIELAEALKNFPPEHRASTPKGAPHNAWQLLEHTRIALHDLLDFCVNPKYVAPEFPAGYWPQLEAPPSSTAWDKSVTALLGDLEAFKKLAGDPQTNLYSAIPWGEGQTILREILLAADHTSYHLGQFVFLKKLLLG